MTPVKLGVWFFVGLLFMGAVLFWYGNTEHIVVGKRVLVSDSDDVINLLKRNTPIRFTLEDNNWGIATIEEPSEIYSIWSILENLELAEEVPSDISNVAEGTIHFFDGSSRRFAISNKFQLGEFILGNRSDEHKIHNLYQILLHTLHSKENLVNLISRAVELRVFDSSRGFASNSWLVMGEQDKRRLINLIGMSERVTELGEVAELILEEGSDPDYLIKIFLPDNGNSSQVVLSVLSGTYFYVTDLSYPHRNMIYFRGNLLDFL